MSDQEWESGLIDGLGIWISGAELRGYDYELRPDATFYLIFSARPDGSRFRLPSKELGEEWALVFDTAHEPAFPARSPRYRSRALLDVESNSVLLLRRVEEIDSGAAALLRRLEGSAST